MESSEPLQYEVGEPQAGRTLAAALRGWLPGRSWSQVRRLIRGRRVLVNRVLEIDDARRLAAGEVVEIVSQSRRRPPRDEQVRIQYYDSHLVVVEKPAGMITLRHAAQRHWPEHRKQLQPTLDEAVTRLLAALESHGTGSSQKHARRGKRGAAHRVLAVHRLDRDASGLVVFARTPEAREALIQQFAHHTAQRVYQAIAAGYPPAGRIESRLVRDRGDGLRGSTADARAGKQAVTHVRPLERIGGYSLVECRLETGRTHQIRIHLAERGCPVCGDTRYRGPLAGPAVADRSGAPRLALHAAELGLAHPQSGAQMQFQMPLPRDLGAFIERLSP